MRLIDLKSRGNFRLIDLTREELYAMGEPAILDDDEEEEEEE